MALNLEKQLVFVSLRVSRLPGTMANSRSMELTTTTLYGGLGAVTLTGDGKRGLMTNLGERRNPHYLCSDPAVHWYHLGKPSR
jgi:hypothetical protein